MSNPTTIPATEALLVGYAGPAETVSGECVTVLHRPDAGGAYIMCSGGINRDYTIRSLRLNLLNPIALDHILRHLAATGHPAWHLRDIASGGTLTVQVAAEAVAWSVVSVERGGRVLRGLTGAWDDSWDVRWMIAGLGTGSPLCTASGSVSTPSGWSVRISGVPHERWLHGPETGPLGRAAADAAALTAGFGLLNPDGLTLPALPVEKT